MKTTTFDDTGAFLAALEPLAATHESAINPLVANAWDDLRARRPPAAAVLVEDGNTVKGAALLARLRPLRLTPLPESALDSVAAALVRLGATPAIVAGEEQTTAAFVERWSRAVGAEARRYFRQYLYVLRTPPEPVAVPGALRPMRPEDLELCAQWTCAFTDEALASRPAGETNTLEQARASLPRRSIVVWERDDRVVSMAAKSGLTPRGCRITGVYTPPEERGRGYASALVGALSAHTLAGGSQYCSIYTDQTNETTNRIYPALGYVRVHAEASYELIPAATR
jgi:predicted GNAT family acetyltransferase